MLRRRQRGARGVAVAAVVVTACVPLTSCDSVSEHADAIGYVAVVTAHKMSQRDGLARPKPAGVSVAAVQIAPVGPVPPYQVIAQRTTDRWDSATTYYVVVGTLDLSAPAAPTSQATESGAPPVPGSDPVDSASVGYKPAVKQVLRALARANGGAEFSAHIWDEGVAAQTEVSYRATPNLFSDEQYAAKQLANARHRIASYQGGVESPGQPAAYVLFWFPDASVDSPREGGLISSEMWQP